MNHLEKNIKPDHFCFYFMPLFILTHTIMHIHNIVALLQKLREWGRGEDPASVSSTRGLDLHHQTPMRCAAHTSYKSSLLFVYLG